MLEKFNAEIISVRKICFIAEKKLKEWSLSDTECYDILLSIDEAITNIVQHGYEKIESVNNAIEFELKKEAGIIKIKLVDFGKSFNFNGIGRPNVAENMKQGKYGGFGVYLMKSLMDSVKYTRENECNVTEMEKRLKVDNS
ncbi:MAG: ATP-binding protein [Leptospirales bacterium]